MSRRQKSKSVVFVDKLGVVVFTSYGRIQRKLNHWPAGVPKQNLGHILYDKLECGQTPQRLHEMRTKNTTSYEYAQGTASRTAPTAPANVLQQRVSRHFR
jgi:hypothetical protein